MDYRFLGHQPPPPVIDLDEDWELLTHPLWPGGFYRQRPVAHDSPPSFSRPAAQRRHQLDALMHPASTVKGLSVDLMV